VINLQSSDFPEALAPIIIARNGNVVPNILASPILS